MSKGRYSVEAGWKLHYSKLNSIKLDVCNPKSFVVKKKKLIGFVQIEIKQTHSFCVSHDKKDKRKKTFTHRLVWINYISGQKQFVNLLYGLKIEHTCSKNPGKSLSWEAKSNSIISASKAQHLKMWFKNFIMIYKSKISSGCRTLDWGGYTQFWCPSRWHPFSTGIHNLCRWSGVMAYIRNILQREENDIKSKKKTNGDYWRIIYYYYYTERHYYGTHSDAYKKYMFGWQVC